MRLAPDAPRAVPRECVRLDPVAAAPAVRVAAAVSPPAVPAAVGVSLLAVPVAASALADPAERRAEHLVLLDLAVRVGLAVQVVLVVLAVALVVTASRRADVPVVVAGVAARSCSPPRR